MIECFVDSSLESYSYEESKGIYSKNSEISNLNSSGKLLIFREGLGFP